MDNLRYHLSYSLDITHLILDNTTLRHLRKHPLYLLRFYNNKESVLSSSSQRVAALADMRTNRTFYKD